MKYGLCIQTMVSLRETPSHKSQMVNQLLFGDLFLIKDNLDNWLFIETIDDNYEAWVENNQIWLIDELEFEKYRKANRAYSLQDSLLSTSSNGEVSCRYTLGSCLPLYKTGSFSIDKNSYTHKNEVQIPGRDIDIIMIAKKYLNAPYLWGGRSIFGIDCSGFTQIVFKMAGIMLPRDSSQQIEKGEVINFLEEARQGDLAFFEDEEGTIMHVGILIDNQTIIHASGKVRIDKIDHNGIYNKELQKYTHKLRLVKRIIE